jgi:uncharacterized protein YdhG (YjbR/CyaY superfamily)
LLDDEENNCAMKKSVPAGSVDGYLSALPEEVRIALEKLRKIIKAAAPGTTEVISYRIPVFNYQGRSLVGFGATKNHWSFFTMSSNMILKLARMRAGELKGYEVSGATIHFTPDKPLPPTLVTKLVKERIAENEKRAKRRV